jgi:serine/threonine-protein kinase
VRPLIVQPVQPPPEAPRPVPVPSAPAQNLMALVDACAAKVFLSKELCLAEHCDKAGARNHPLCVKRREEARLREESKVRQGPQVAP